MKQPKERKCANINCKGTFIQYRSTQKVCSMECAIILAKVTRERNERQDWAKKKKELRDKDMTITDWVKKVQVTFNAYIRERDRETNCISCDKKLIGKFDAGHYHNANNHWSVRFDTRNVWGQCVRCNRDLHANLINYRIGLLQRIGPEQLAELDSIAKETRKFSIDELKSLNEYWKMQKKILYKNEE